MGMAYSWPTDPTTAFGTTFEGPIDVKQIILNGQDMESRIGVLEVVPVRAVSANTTPRAALTPRTPRLTTRMWSCGWHGIEQRTAVDALRWL